MEMVEETLTKKQKQMLAMEDYLDLVDGHKKLVDLTVRQLNQILGMHGFNKMNCQKKNLVEVVSRIQQMSLGRSTVQDDGVSSCGCLTLKEVIKDLKDIDWHECHVTSLLTQNAAYSASTAVPVKKPEKVGAATTGTTSSAGTNGAASVKKTKKARVAASVTTTGTASSAGTNRAIPVKKPKKARVAASVSTTGTTSSVGTNSAVPVKKPKKSRVAASGTAVAASGIAVAAGSTTTGV